MKAVHLNYGLSGLRVKTGLHRKVRIGMLCKMEKIGVYLRQALVDPITLSSDKLCFPFIIDISPLLLQILCTF